MKSVLVIGMGRFGRHLAKKMADLGNDVVIVDRDEEVIDRYANVFTDAQVGDCTNVNVVHALGVNHYDVCFVAIGEDFQSSLVVTSLLKELGAKYVVSKAKQDIQADLLKKIGADEVVCPEREAAEKLAIRHNADNIFDYIKLTSEYAIYEIPMPTAFAGKTISEINIRQKFNINIIAMKEGSVLRPMPGPDYRFKSGDHMVVLGKSTDVFRLAAKL